MRDNKQQYDIYYMMVDTLELWLRDTGVKMSDEQWFDLLSRLAEVEKQLG